MKKIISLLLIIVGCKLSFAQSNSTSHAYSLGWYLGWSTGNNLDFGTNGSPFQMNLKTNGSLRITDNSSNQNAYMLGDSNILWHNGIIQNLYVGHNAGNSTNTGINDLCVGYDAGIKLTSGSDNTFVGFRAGFQNTTNSGGGTQQNTFLGSTAGYYNTTGQYATYLGYGAGYYNNSDYNTLIGNQSGYNLGNGLPSPNNGTYRNTFLGYYTGYYLVKAFNNCFFGNHTGQGMSTTGYPCYRNNFIGSYCAENIYQNVTDNNFLGAYAGNNCQNGIANILIGTNTGANFLGKTAADSNNIFIGYSSGLNFNGGNYNILLGSNTVAKNSINNSSAIGASAITNKSNQIILGGNYATGTTPAYENVKVGIGLSNDYGSSGNGGPTDYLEINADPSGNHNNANNNCQFHNTFNSGLGKSGLTFRQLRSGTSGNTPSPLSAANGTCLAVNSSGQVIMVPYGAAGSGSTCGASTPNFLTGNWEIPLVGTGTNQWSYYFSGQSTGANSSNPVDVGIGYSCSTALTGKLDVLNKNQLTSNNNNNIAAGRFVNTGNVSNSGDLSAVYGYNDIKGVGGSLRPMTNIGGDFYALNSDINIGLRATTPYSPGFVPGYATAIYGVVPMNAAGNSSIGVQGDANSNSPLSIGVFGNSNNISASSGSVAIGVKGVSNSSSVPASFGGYFIGNAVSGGGCSGTPHGKFGIYTTVIPSGPAGGTTSTNYGIYADACGSNNFWAGYYNGKLGGVTNFFVASDSLLKISVAVLTGDSALTILNKLNPKTYVYDSVHYPSMHFASGSQFGLIAQQVARVLPTLTTDVTHPAYVDSTGHVIYEAINYKALNYNAFIPILIAGVKKIDSIVKATPNQVNNGLSIDSNTIQLGGALVHNTAINMGNQNLYITTQNTGKMGVGHPSTDSLFAQLDVLNTADYTCDGSNQTAGKFVNTGSCSNSGTYAGVLGNSTVNDDGINIGGDFSAYHGATNIGVRATIDGGDEAIKLGEDGTTLARGGYALYADASSSTNYWAGYFNGNVGTTCGWYQASDGKLKENVKQISVALSHDIISQLKPSTYTFKTDGQKSMNLPQGKQYGLIAEDVEKVMPELVREMSVPAKKDKQGNVIAAAQQFKGVNYIGMIPVLIAALQHSDSIVNSLQQQINSIKATCGYTATFPNNTGNSSSVTLGDLQIILDQNAPNPFAEQTTIGYTIPESVHDAKIIFYTNNGTILKSIEITERGNGNVVVYASNLSEGLYSYSLVADGKVIDTKKMICEKH